MSQLCNGLLPLIQKSLFRGSICKIYSVIYFQVVHEFDESTDLSLFFTYSRSKGYNRSSSVIDVPVSFTKT